MEGIPRGFNTLDEQVTLLLGDVTIHSLRTKLFAAIDSFQRGQTNAAVHQLRAFINEVEALVRARRLDATTGAFLIQEANAIIADT